MISPRVCCLDIYFILYNTHCSITSLAWVLYLPACEMSMLLFCLLFALLSLAYSVFYIIHAWIKIKELFQILHGVRSGIRRNLFKTYLLYLPACEMSMLLFCLLFALLSLAYSVFYIIHAWIKIKELFQILHGVRSGIRRNLFKTFDITETDKDIVIPYLIKFWDYVAPNRN